MWSFCLCVILSCCSRITEKVMSRFHWNSVICLCLRLATTDLRLMGFRSQIRTSDQFSIFLSTAEWKILGDLLAFLIQWPADFVLRNLAKWLTRQGNESKTLWARSGVSTLQPQPSITLFYHISDHHPLVVKPNLFTQTPLRTFVEEQIILHLHLHYMTSLLVEILELAEVCALWTQSRWLYDICIGSYPSVSIGASGGGGSGEGEVFQDSYPDHRSSASIASLRLLAKEHQLQTMLDVTHSPTTFLRWWHLI